MSNFRKVPKERAFDGDTYNSERDHVRLSGQLLRVFELMRDGDWRSLPHISAMAHGSEASVSARLRDLRKAKYGAHVLERICISKGFWLYRLIENIEGKK